MSKKLVVAGEVYSTNLGDGVIYDCVTHLFARYGVKTTPLDFSARSPWSEEGVSQSGSGSGPSWARRVVRVPVRRSRVLRRGISAGHWYLKNRQVLRRQWSDILEASDGVVIGGGQLLTDRDFGFPPKIAEVVQLAKKHGKPVAFFGCGADPRWGYAAQRLYRDALAYASYVSVRDYTSAGTVRDALSGSRDVRIHPDPAFIAAAAYPATGRGVSKNVIGLAPQPVQHFRTFVPELRKLDEASYCAFWASAAKKIAAKGGVVRFFSNGSVEDQAQAERICDLLSNQGHQVELAPRPRTPIELVRLIRGLSAVVCTRMHAGIIAMASGNIVAPISWDPKVSSVWKMLNRQEMVLSPNIVGSSEGASIAIAALEQSDRQAGPHELGIVRKTIELEAEKCLSGLGLL